MTLVKFSCSAFKISITTFCCLVAFSSITSSVLAQRAPDAGALQQNMQRQSQTPSELGLPEPSAPEFAPLDLSKSETLFIVKRFALTGVNLVAVEEVDR